MRVSLIAALTADGYIARSNHELVNWTSIEDKRYFSQLTRQAGVVVMGGATYRTIGRPLVGRRTIVYSRQKSLIAGVELTQETPQQLTSRLEREHVAEIVLCGGNDIYTMFLTASVVDELYITIEPTLFGQGVRLLSQSLNMTLQLIEYRLLNKSTMLLHYEVQR